MGSALSKLGSFYFLNVYVRTLYKENQTNLNNYHTGGFSHIVLRTKLPPRGRSNISNSPTSSLIKQYLIKLACNHNNIYALGRSSVILVKF